MELIARLSLPDFLHSIVIASILIAPGCGNVRLSGEVLPPLDNHLHWAHRVGLCSPFPIQRRVERLTNMGRSHTWTDTWRSVCHIWSIGRYAA